MRALPERNDGMKRGAEKACALCLTVCMLLQLALFAGWQWGYLFSDACGYLVSFVSLCMAMVVCVLLGRNKSAACGAGVGLLTGLSAVLCSVSALMFVFIVENAGCMILMFISAVMLLSLMNQSMRLVFVRMAAMLLSVALLIPAITVGPFVVYVPVMNFGKSTVVMEIPSPDQKYICRVIDNDQGALGGSTQVYVEGHRQYGFGPFYFKKAPVKLYTGYWGEYQNMQIHWENSDVIVIDGNRYLIE